MGEGHIRNVSIKAARQEWKCAVSALVGGETLLLLLLTLACSKTTSAPFPPSPLPPAAAATVEKPVVNFFRAEPGTVANGQSAVLRWSIANAFQIRIDNGIGEVKADGDREVHPPETTTYKLEARNSSGAVEATAVVTIAKRPAPLPAAHGSSRPTAEIEASELQDVHFEYDSDQIQSTDQPIFEKDAAVLKKLFLEDPAIIIEVEGHCDERGSAEYNLGLGDRRAALVKQALVDTGLPAIKLQTVSYGKERLLCLEPSEECHAMNRRAHFSIGR